MKILPNLETVAKTIDDFLVPNDCREGITGRRGKIEHKTFEVVDIVGVGNCLNTTQFRFEILNPTTKKWQLVYGCKFNNPEILEGIRFLKTIKNV